MFSVLGLPSMPALTSLFATTTIDTAPPDPPAPTAVTSETDELSAEVLRRRIKLLKRLAVALEATNKAYYRQICEYREDIRQLFVWIRRDEIELRDIEEVLPKIDTRRWYLYAKDHIRELKDDIAFSYEMVEWGSEDLKRIQVVHTRSAEKLREVKKEILIAEDRLRQLEEVDESSILKAAKI